MIMWKYEIWQSGSLLHEDEDFETEEDAIEEAHEELDSRFDYWKSENSYDGETYEDFDIRTEYIEMEEEL